MVNLKQGPRSMAFVHFPEICHFLVYCVSGFSLQVKLGKFQGTQEIFLSLLWSYTIIGPKDPFNVSFWASKNIVLPHELWNVSIGKNTYYNKIFIFKNIYKSYDEWMKSQSVTKMKYPQNGAFYTKYYKFWTVGSIFYGNMDLSYLILSQLYLRYKKHISVNNAKTLYHWAWQGWIFKGDIVQGRAHERVVRGVAVNHS